MSEERSILVSLTESELILIGQSLDALASAKSILAHDCAAEDRYRQARAHGATVTKATDLAGRLYDLAEEESRK